MSVAKLTKPDRCAAINPNGTRCRRNAVRAERYHGDSQFYGYFNEPWPSWVYAPLCDKHSEANRWNTPRKVKR